MRNYSKVITLKDGNHVWTRCVGSGSIKILLLHGGPGMTHDYLTPFTDFIKDKDIQVIYYDQLGSYSSDQPDDTSLWNIDRFCDEVEEVRSAWGLENFYLYGQSWGGLLAMEYASRPEYRKHLKGLIDSNMIDSLSDYTPYVRKYRDEALSPEDVKYMHEAEENGTDTTDPKYEELCLRFYHKCMCRLDEWPHDVNAAFEHVNEQVYVYMQGTSEFSITGTLKTWSIRDRLHEIDVPTLVLGGKYDTMNPKKIKETANRFPNAKVHICPNGSHFSIWDDQENYFEAISNYLNEVENGKF